VISIGPLAALLLAAGAPSADTGRTGHLFLDRLSYKVELPMPVAGSGTPTRVSLYHEYPTCLSHFRLVSGSGRLQVTQSPPEIAVFKPTLIETVELSITPLADIGGDTCDLPLKAVADELRPGQTFVVTVPLTPEGARQLHEEMAVPAGQIEVTVKPYANLQYYAWIALTVVVMAVLMWRKVRAR
jgi:hypothetical protein